MMKIMKVYLPILLLSIVACSKTPTPLKLKANILNAIAMPWGEAIYYSQSRKITCLLVTEDYLWAGTNQGLQQWSLEGNRYQVITSRDGLPDDNIKALTITTSGSVWAATGKGLSSWTNGSWQNQTFPVEGEPTALAATVTGDAVWAGTTKGLAFYVFGRWVVYSSKAHVTALKPNTESGVWLGTKANGLFFCENGTCAPRTSPLKEVTAIDMEGDDVWAAGLASDKSPLFVLFRGKDTYIYDAPGPVGWIQRYGGNVLMNFGDAIASVVPCASPTKNSFVNRTRRAPCMEAVPFAKPLPMRITSMYRTGGNLWVGTETLGVTRYTDSDMQQYSADDLVSSNIVGMSLECVPGAKRCYFSAGKNSFVFEHGAGFSPIPLADHPGWSLSYFTTTPEGVLTAVARNGQGTIGFFERNGEGAWNPRSEPPMTLDTNDTNVRIRFAHYTKPYIVWVGISSSSAQFNGIQIVNFEKSRVNPPQNYRTAKNKPAQIPDSVKTLYKRGENRYLATNEGLVTLFRGDDSKKVLEITNSTSGLPTDIVEDVLVEPSGQIWLATDMGVCIRKFENTRWLCGTEGPMPDAGHTFTLARDPQTGTIYAAAGTALYRFRDGRTETLDAEKYLHNPKVLDMKIDLDGMLWILHPEALSQVRLSSR